MSFAELKEQIVELPQSDRLRLAALLAELDDREEPAFREEVGCRMKAMDAGRKVAMEEFEEKHAALKKQGL